MSLTAVLSTPKRTRKSSKSSNATVINPATFAGSLYNLPVGNSSAATATADFNLDGNPDLVVGLGNTALSTNLAVFLGSGDGSFSSAIQLASGGLNPLSLVTGDFNNDGNPDIAVANYGSNTVALLLGTGRGGFQTAQTYEVGSQPNSIAAGNFNDDRQLDLVTANSGSDSLTVLLAKPTGGFRTTTLKTAGTQPFAVATGDFNGDGNLDIVSADASSNSISLFLGNGDGTFKAAKQYFVGSGTPVSIVTGDFDGDGKLDLATGNLGGNGQDISVLFGDGTGNFSTGITLSAGAVNSLIKGDFNVDGYPDLAATTSAGNLVTFFGDGKGNFTASNAIGLNSSPGGLSKADFNGDGKLDLAAASSGSNNATIVLNKTSSVVLRSSKTLSEVDGSQETTVSMNVNLDQGTLVVNSSPAVRRSIQGFENVLGTQKSDVIIGDSSDNRLVGNGGSDRIVGNGGNDTLIGGAGRDTLDGSGGNNDQLIGGIGSDTLIGGSGNNQFIFDDGVVFTPANGHDLITNFVSGRDKIVLARSMFPGLGKKVRFAAVNSLAAAGSSSAIITYVRSSGRLYYNADGVTPGFGDGGWFASFAKTAIPTVTAAAFSTRP
jgi:Ca2+-binding RTX toxin-like protein